MMQMTEEMLACLRAQAREKSCSYRELAEKSGLSERAIRNIFQGITKTPRVSTLQRLMKAMDEIQ